MTVQAPFDRVAVETALVAWVESAAGVSCMIANQNAPQPSHPFAELAIIAARDYGQADEQETNPVGAPSGQEVQINAGKQKRITVSLNMWSSTNDASQDARALMDKALAALDLPSYRDTLKASGIAVLNAPEAQSLDELESNSVVQRAQADCFFGIAANVSERTGYIATMQTTSDAPIGNSTFQTVKS